MITREYLEQRKRTLEAEAGKAQQELANLRGRLAQVEQAALQIGGALILCDEMLGIVVSIEPAAAAEPAATEGEA